MSAPATERPPRLREGDTIAVVAPSGPALPEDVRRGVAELATYFRVVVAPSAAEPAPPPGARYLAAADQARADELNRMLGDPDVRAILMARGGYGLLRILPALDASLLRADPKPLVGFSDGTALLSWAHAAGVRGVHGQVVIRVGGERPETLPELIRALTDPRPPGRLPWALHRWAEPSQVPLEAPMIPGNLVMACHLIGTPWQLPLTGAAFWMEEVGERPYELDRALTHLHLAGALAETAGVVVGDLVRCMEKSAAGEPDDPREALAVVEERLRAFGVPALHGAPFGHGRHNPPLPFGARCRLDFAAATVEILEGAVA